MANLQDISFQLMKSPKELASWSFPLSDILEEYFSLLPEPCYIRYGEVALVIQNSVNAYVRKVEDLYDETKCFSEKILVNSKKDEENVKKDRKTKSLIDFDQFDLLNFDDGTGHNINHRNYKGKPLKFLYQCFSQLENVQSKINNKVIDTNGEIVGKKYDYRCNQQITKCGTLVEEFTLEDFEVFNSESIIPNDKSSNEKLSNISNKLDNGINNYNHNNENDMKTPVLAVEGEKIFQNDSMNNQSPVHNFDSYTLDTLESVEKQNSTIYSRPDQELLETFKNDESTLIDDWQPNEMNNDENDQSGDNSSDINFSELQNLTENNDNIQNVINSESSITHETAQKNELCENNNTKKEEKCNSIEVQNDRYLTSRKSERLQKKQEEYHKCENNNLLKPVLFNDGIPSKTDKSKKELQLPCRANLLKSAPSIRKRKKFKKLIKRDQSIERASVHSSYENDLDNEDTKMSMDSLSESEYSMKKEDNNENESFNSNKNFIVTYEPVTTVKMDLLGFHPNYKKKCKYTEMSENTLKMSPKSSHYDSPSKIFTPTSSLYEFNCFSTNTEQDKKEENCTKSYNFEKLIKYKIKKICNELDLQTDEDQKVIKWHEEIKPRLLEAERKPLFHIHEYQSRIIQRLETCHRKLQFNKLIEEESPSEIARYFSAVLHLASSNNLIINTSENLDKSIELILIDQD